MAALWLGVRLSLRVDSRGARPRQFLNVLTVTIATAVLLLMSSLPGALTSRMERAAQRTPVTATSQIDRSVLLLDQQDLINGRPAKRVLALIFRDLAVRGDPSVLAAVEG